jgi:hypothetical protein
VGHLDYERGGLVDEDGEFIPLAEFNRIAPGGDWQIDRERRCIRRPDQFISLAELKAAVEALESGSEGDAAEPVEPHVRKPGDTFFPLADLQNAIYALENPEEAQ